MVNVVIGLAVLLILVILLTLIRVGNLIGLVQKKDDEPVDSTNKVNAALLMVFLVFGLVIFFWYSSAEFENYTVPLASEHGKATDSLFWWTTGITSVVFVITHILLFYFSYRYQYKKNTFATFFAHNNKLEVLWTAVPAVVLMFLIGGGLLTWWEIFDKAPEEAEVVEVFGFQFAWASRYPGADNALGNHNYKLIDDDNKLGVDYTDPNAKDDFLPREIHIPKGKPVLFKIRARDVIHSVYVPHFRLQMNAVPGLPTQFWFVPTKSTEDMRLETGNPEFNYELVCNKICGKGHFAMKHIIVVDEPDEYEAWKKEQTPWLEKNPEYLAKISRGDNILASNIIE